MGWYMVSSGLVNRPAVSHYRLTIHLFLALILLGMTFWTALYLTYGSAGHGRKRTAAYWLTIVLIGTLTIQILYGGLVAGLKAGHASASWPLMFGYLVPPGLLSVVQPWWRNMLEVGATVHFTHRWFAWLVLAVSIVLYYVAKRGSYSAPVDKGLLWMTGLIAAQIALGVSVIWFHVPIVLALSHQAMALLLFLVALYLNHRILGESARVTQAEPAAPLGATG
jgi:cytochrome c oxidase assembly protein subunit 15